MANADEAARQLIADDFRLECVLPAGIAAVCFTRGIPVVGITVRDNAGKRVTGKFTVMGVSIEVDNNGRAEVDLDVFRKEAAKVGCNFNLPWEGGVQ